MNLDPARREAWTQALTARMKKILASGEKPSWVFLCRIGQDATLCLPPTNGQSSLLLFTSPLLALDYLRAIGMEGKVTGVRVEAISNVPRGWPELGVHSFCLNRCPRCNVALTYSFTELESVDSFLKVWALERAARFMKGQLLAQAVVKAQAQGGEQMIKALEKLRDHAAADNPHVYQLLAMLAGSRSDPKGRATALMRLEEFQLPVKLETDDFAGGFAEGIVGLMATFELLRLPVVSATT
jgi:hypothetical protein